MEPYLQRSPYLIQSAAQQFKDTAAFLRQTSAQVEYVKLVSILSIVALLAEIAMAAATAFFTFGSSLADLAERLSDRLETRVRVQLGKRKGKVLIEFATLDDLQRICDAIGLEERTVRLPEVPLTMGSEPQIVQDERTTTSAPV